ncbi:MAG: calcium/sodium antiporter [Propionibacteriaceae bacterium]|nr:calcium/sodium antiporter [Propionibacteriaceae bacterium]
MLDYLLLVVGLTLLVIGGDVLVKGAVGLAEKLKVPALIIGLTIVAFGTSAPELFISIQAALAGASGIAIGNVVGSNIANVLLVMGLPALIAASRCDDAGIGRNIVVMIGFTIVFMAILFDGVVSRAEGAVLLVLLALFLYDQMRSAKQANNEAPVDIHDEVGETPSSMPVILALLAIGLLALPFGADLTVDSASSIARRWNVSDDVIGLTIVAIGTSMPELVTTLVSTFRGQRDVAIGNLIGSSVYNLAFILGATALVAPLEVTPELVRIDLPVMVAVSLVCIPVFLTGRTVSRREGIAFIVVYAAYLGALLLLRT